MIAFEYTAGWGVLLTAVVALLGTGGTLAGVVMTQRSARKDESDRRKHERTLRGLELSDGHVGRLYEKRLAAYSEVRLRMIERRRAFVRGRAAEERLSPYWAPDAAPPPSELEDEYSTAMDASSDAAQRLEEALVSLELVASSPVRAAVTTLLEAVDRVRWNELRLRPTGAERDERVAAINAARRDAAIAEEALREAIRDELGLDRGWGDERRDASGGEELDSTSDG